jgi:oxygen-independent coproporphyrinogen-3 oxidase
MLQFQQTIPLSLYLHLPWCLKKCPYCDFNSHEAGTEAMREEEYVDALIRDLEFELPRIWGRRIISLFIGGGTPSLFSAAALDRLLSAIQARLNFSSGIEITLEVNPGTAEARKFKDHRQTGINRLSIGVQSFNDEKLNSLGRIHTSKEALNAIAMARDAGFENINLDLMFGLPKQTVDDAIKDLQTAIDQGPDHISWYQLTIEPNTIYYSHPPDLPAEDRIWDMQQQGQKRLANEGFRQYEISAYARDKRHCVHNINYWQFGDYLGLGAGAHGKLTEFTTATINRYARQRLPESYLQNAGSENVMTDTRGLDREDIVLEFMMNALRLEEGVPVSLFNERTGLPIGEAEEPLRAAQAKGLIEWDSEILKPTAKGQRYLNDLLQLFMPVNNEQKTLRGV